MIAAPCVRPEDLTRLVRHLLEEKRVTLPAWRADEAERARFRAQVAEAIVTLRLPVDGAGIQAATAEVAGLLTGIGVLTPLLDEPGVEEIVVRQRPDGRAHVQVERNGVIEDLGELAPMEHFRQVLERAADSGGAMMKADSPLVVVDLPGGHRLTAIIPPLSRSGVAINIRRFTPAPFSLGDLARAGAMPDEVAAYLARAVEANIASALIVGASGAGKTTLLNALCLHVPHTAQLALAETFQELRPAHPYPVRVAAPAELRPHEAAAGKVTLREVVSTIYTRMRPDLILVGEVVAAEAVEFLRAINLGCRAMTTIHGESALGGLRSLEALAVQYGGLEAGVARDWIARGVDLVIHMDRAADGARFVSEIALLDGLSEEAGYRLRTLFRHARARQSRAAVLEALWARREASA